MSSVLASGHKKVTLVLIYLTFLREKEIKNIHKFGSAARRIKVVLILHLAKNDDFFADGFDHDYDHVDDDFVDDNDNADQNLPPAGEGGDVEGHVGEDEEGVSVLRELLQSRHVVRTSEGQVYQEAKIFRSI